MRRISLLYQFSAISLVLFLAIGAILGWGLTHHFEQQAIDQQTAAVRDLVPPLVSDFFNDDRVLAEGAHDDPEDPNDLYSQVDRSLAFLRGSGLARIKVWNRQGKIIFSDRPEEVGQVFPVEGNEDLRQALEGYTTAHITNLDKEENRQEEIYGELLEVYTPLLKSGMTEIVAVFEGYYDVDDLRAKISATNEFLWASIITGFLFLYVSLFTIVRNASQQMLRQSRENAMLLADTEREADRLAMVNELARSINSSSLNLSQVFETALRGIDRIVDHRIASITLLDERTGEPLNTIFSHPMEPGTPEGRRTLGQRTSQVPSGGQMPQSVDVEMQKKLLGEADTFLWSDARLTGGVPELTALAARGVLSLLLVSIGLGERRLGLLSVFSDRPYAFDEGDAAILKGVADQLAVAIENNRLIKETAETTALRETNRLKDEFVSMVSHELRTPLASIKGYSKTLLAADGDWDEETQREFLSIIAGESDKLTELVENLLEMSRIEAGRLPISPEPLLLHRFCQEVVDRVTNHYPNMQFNCKVDEHLPMVIADPRRVEQVLLNLMQNAAKYSGASCVETHVSYDGGKEVKIAVRDDGVGIAPVHLPFLFNKFYRVEASKGESESGTGLGLAIVKALVEAQGGRIWVESKPGEGTTFTFTLPVLMLDEEAQHELTGHSASGANGTGSKSNRPVPANT